MGRKGVMVPPNVKLKYAKLCFENKMSKLEAARQLNVNDGVVRGWVYRYRENGELSFLDTAKNNVYSDELRLKAVCSYLNGEGSLREVAARYGLRSKNQFQVWIKMYNDGKDFSQHRMSGGSQSDDSESPAPGDKPRQS